MTCPTTARPLPVREGQPMVDRAATPAEPGRRVETIDDCQVPAVPRRLVLDLSPELPEGRIVETLGQLGSRKAANAQVFDAEPLMIPDEVGRQLVEEVLSSVGDLPVNP